MNLRSRLSFVIVGLFFATANAHVQDSDQTLEDSIKRYAAAVKAYDVMTILDMMYTPYVDSIGGREKIRKGIPGFPRLSDPNRPLMLLLETLPPYQRVSTSKNDYAIIRTHATVLESTGNSHDVDRFILAIRARGSTKWEFLNGSYLTQEERDRFFPDLKGTAFPNSGSSPNIPKTPYYSYEPTTNASDQGMGQTPVGPMLSGSSMPSSSSASPADPASDSSTPQFLARDVLKNYREHKNYLTKTNLAHHIDVLTQGTKNFPLDPQLFFALGLCYLLQPNLSAALASLDSAYKLSLDDPTIGIFYVETLEANEQPLKAYEIAKITAGAHLDNVEAQCVFGIAAAGVQKYGEAIGAVEPFLEKAGGIESQFRSPLRVLLGACYLYEGNDAKSIELLQAVIADRPKDAKLLGALGEAYLKSGNLEKARIAFDQSIEVNPHYAATLYYKGILLEKTGDTKAAEEIFQKAYAEGKGHLEKTGPGNYLMYQVCQKLSKNDEARKYEQKAAELHFNYEAPWASDKPSPPQAPQCD